VDATLRLTVRSERHPDAALVTHVATLLQRDDATGLWRSRLTNAEARDLVLVAFHDGWLPHAGGGVVGVPRPYWYNTIGDQPHPGVLDKTQAPRYPGAREAELAAALGLPRQDGHMQDWPLEVADHVRLDDVLAFYERACDDLVRFDAMALALCVYDDRMRAGGGPCARLERLLRRGFWLHGNTVEDWCELDILTSAGELSVAADRDRLFAITPAMRRVWLDSVHPLALV
jgi:hypothetical protein